MNPDETLEQKCGRLTIENAKLRYTSEQRRQEILSLRERIGHLEKPAPQVITCGALQVDATRHRVYLGTKQIVMARRMFQLLYFFASHPDELFSHEDLLTMVWGSKDYEVSNVTEQVRRIRSLIGEGWIETTRGVGYTFVVPR